MPASWHTYNIAGEVPNCHSKTNPDITEIAFYDDQLLVFCNPNSNNDFTDFIRQITIPRSFSEAKNHSEDSPLYVYYLSTCAAQRLYRLLEK